jgi:dipeptidyl aminopeptidase/acylaminoacyl peptidase
MLASIYERRVRAGPSSFFSNVMQFSCIMLLNTSVKMRLTSSSVFLLLLISTLSMVAAFAQAAAVGDVPPAPDAAATRETRLLRADDLDRAARVSEPDVSPDGRWVAYVVATADRAADEVTSTVWMVSWDGAERLPLTRPTRGIHAPRWSPDGRYLAYLAPEKDSGRDQIMLIDRRGGEARALASGADIAGYAWSPDGTRIVASVQGREEEHASAPKPIVIEALYFKQDEDGYLALHRQRGLLLVEVADGKTTMLTPEGRSDDTVPAWSPDGRRIAFARTRELNPDPDGMEDIRVIDARTGAVDTELLRTYAPNHQHLAWGADGTLAYLAGQEPRLNQYMGDRLMLASTAAGNGGESIYAVGAGGSTARPRGAGDHTAPRRLAAALDRGITSFARSGAGSIEATIADDATAYAVLIDTRSGRFEARAGGAHSISALSVGGGHAAVLYTDDRAPPEVYSLEDGRLRKLTAHNDALMSGLRLGRVEDFRVNGVHGLMVKPPGYVAGRAYPTVIWLHGGPNGQDAHELSFSGDQFKRQWLASRGFVVLGVNYHGSSGRGSAFQTSIAADWGRLETGDVLAAVDRAVKSGLADAHRVGIGGWSYGAILTDYAIAADGRFKAAIAGAGSANVTAMYGGDQYIIQYNDELGVPWRNAARWLRLSSPFLHADRIHTPTLFMGGDRDFDVPLIGGEQMYQALRTLGVPAELVVYPGEYHSIKRPSFVVDRLQRMAAWFERYL